MHARTQLKRRLFLGAALPTLGAPCALASPRVVRLPQHLSAIDPQLGYVQALVKLALTKAGVTAEVQPTPLEMQQSRSLVELAAGKSPFDLLWTLTDIDREAAGALPVHVPIDRGLMGWRLLLVRKAELARWAEVSSLSALRRYVAGQGHDWPDTAILKANDLPVTTSTNYEALFRMLEVGRFDYFPRSILEIDAEVARGRHPDLAIVPGLMLHYPAAAYLFVSPGQPELARELTRGLEAAVADGSLQKLHLEHYGALLRAHPVAPERVIRLMNPRLPPSTPLHRPELWLQPDAAT